MPFMKLFLTLMMIISTAVLSLICNTPGPSSEAPVRNYTLQNGTYEMVTEFIDAISGAKEQQTLVVTVENNSGDVKIKAISSDRGFVFANPIVGILDGNTFKGNLDDLGGRLGVEGKLIANNKMEGGFYEENGSLLTSFTLYE